VTDSEYS